MIRNRYLPQLVHRVACGVMGTSVTATIACVGLRYLEWDSWWHTAAKALLWSSVPVGIFLAYIANRFSIVEGCAGDAGYDDLETNQESKTRD